MAKGKWADIVKTLPKFVNPDDKYNEKVRVLKSKIIAEATEPLNVATLTRDYIDVRKREAEVEEKLSAIHLEKAALSDLLTEAFEVEAGTSWKTDEGSSVRVQYEPYSSVIDRDALRKWAIEAGLERELQLAWQTMNALTKERLQAGLPPPDGVEATSKPKLVYTK